MVEGSPGIWGLAGDSGGQNQRTLCEPFRGGENSEEPVEQVRRKKTETPGRAQRGKQKWMFTCCSETAEPWEPGDERLRKEGADERQRWQGGQVGVDRCPSESSVGWWLQTMAVQSDCSCFEE